MATEPDVEGQDAGRQEQGAEQERLQQRFLAADQVAGAATEDGTTRSGVLVALEPDVEGGAAERDPRHGHEPDRRSTEATVPFAEIAGGPADDVHDPERRGG